MSETKGGKVAAAGTIGLLLGILGTLLAAQISASSVRQSDIRVARISAYSDYLGAHAEYNEFIWANLHHSGADQRGMTPEEEADFWPKAALIQQTLESENIRARLLANETRLDTALQSMHAAQQESFLRYKCMAGHQTACTVGEEGNEEEITLAENDDIHLMLVEWSSDAYQYREEVIKAATRQLH